MRNHIVVGILYKIGILYNQFFSLQNPSLLEISLLKVVCVIKSSLLHCIWFMQIIASHIF